MTSRSPPSIRASPLRNCLIATHHVATSPSHDRTVNYSVTTCRRHSQTIQVSISIGKLDPPMNKRFSSSMTVQRTRMPRTQRDTSYPRWRRYEIRCCQALGLRQTGLGRACPAQALRGRCTSARSRVVARHTARVHISRHISGVTPARNRTNSLLF